jgi:hypothetical protein
LNKYLQNLPDNLSEFGISKVLLVRKETIHIKHILTEILERKTIDIMSYLDKIEMDFFQYMSIITNRLRTIYNFPRTYIKETNEVVKFQFSRFFPSIENVKPLKTAIILDFDGVITRKNFKQLYELCCERGQVIVCTANPSVTNDYFKKRKMTLPFKISSNWGKVKKIKQLIEISKRYDYCFYIDDEPEYLQYAWLFGIRTFIYKKGKILIYSMNTK